MWLIVWGPKTRHHRACSRILTSLVLSRSLRFAAKILYEIMLVGIFCISASFSRNFSGLWAGLGSCFGDFCGFSYFFLDFFSAFGFGWGAVLGISAVSATFFWIFFGFWVDFGSCFKSFMDYSSNKGLPTLLSTYGYCTLC